MHRAVKWAEPMEQLQDRVHQELGMVHQNMVAGAVREHHSQGQGSWAHAHDSHSMLVLAAVAAGL